MKCFVIKTLFYIIEFRYIGEIISDTEADTREDDSYLFDLDNKVRTSISLGINLIVCDIQMTLGF